MPKDYHVVRITDGAVAKVELPRGGGLVIGWTKNRKRGMIWFRRDWAQMIAALLDGMGQNGIRKVIIEEADHA